MITYYKILSLYYHLKMVDGSSGQPIVTKVILKEDPDTKQPQAVPVNSSKPQQIFLASGSSQGTLLTSAAPTINLSTAKILSPSKKFFKVFV